MGFTKDVRPNREAKTNQPYNRILHIMGTHLSLKKRHLKIYTLEDYLFTEYEGVTGAPPPPLNSCTVHPMDTVASLLSEEPCFWQSPLLKHFLCPVHLFPDKFFCGSSITNHNITKVPLSQVLCLALDMNYSMQGSQKLCKVNTTILPFLSR